MKYVELHKLLEERTADGPLLVVKHGTGLEMGRLLKVDGRKAHIQLGYQRKILDEMNAPQAKREEMFSTFVLGRVLGKYEGSLKERYDAQVQRMDKHSARAMRIRKFFAAKFPLLQAPQVNRAYAEVHVSFTSMEAVIDLVEQLELDNVRHRSNL